MVSTLNKFPKISVVTPNFNQGDFIESTILSVIKQNYPNLEYIIIDGGSTDNSLEIIKKYDKHFTFWSSEPDSGMYQAINKGFKHSAGDIMCWINSDDVLWENALFKIANVFMNNHKVSWIQGLPSVINASGDLVAQRNQVFSQYFFYFNKHINQFSFVQQESTFWRRALWEKAGGKLNESYNLAADFDLWLRFFKHEKMYCVNTQLAAFRLREGQKSANNTGYLLETEKALQYNFSKLNFIEKFTIKLLTNYQQSRIKLFRRIALKLQLMLIGSSTYVE